MIKKTVCMQSDFGIELQMKFSVHTCYFFTLLVLAACINTRAQSPTLSSVQTSLDVLSEKFPQEKIYIHFDKPTYAAGETIWFKTYIMSGSGPSGISKTAYIDFINTDGRILKHCIAPVLQSGASGSYDIPLEFKEEVVYVKAYTKWMINFDSSFFYRKTLHIIQPKANTKKRPAPPAKTSIQFLPEGGDMVENIEGLVAFKAIHFDGTPAAVTGTVFNTKNEKIADIKTV